MPARGSILGVIKVDNKTYLDYLIKNFSDLFNLIGDSTWDRTGYEPAADFAGPWSLKPC
jgi:hypothetical protein